MDLLVEIASPYLVGMVAEEMYQPVENRIRDIQLSYLFQQRVVTTGQKLTKICYEIA